MCVRVHCGSQHEREVVLTVTLFVGIVSQQQYLRACRRCRQEGERCRDCPVSRCVVLLIVVLTLDSYLSLCRLVLAY